MVIIDAKRNARIQQLVMANQEAVVDTTIDLWNRLARELASIIGESGFISFYDRSVHLSSRMYPWLEDRHGPPAGSARFAALRESLNERDLVEATQASVALFTNFIDTLGLMIGEHLTNSILRAAWGDDVAGTANEEPA